MKRQLYLICIFIGLCLGGTKAASDYYFKQISLEEGLSQSTVRCITTDYKGVIWIGTRFGLNSFDREQIKTYYQEKDDPSSLPYNEIDFLTEDIHHNLWIGTEYGLCLYNREKDNFTRIIWNDRPLISRACQLVKDGVLFFGRGEVYKYNYTNGNIEKLEIMNKEPLPSSYIDQTEMYSEEEGLILLSCRWEGTWWYNMHTREMKKASFTNEREITAIHIDSDYIWLSAYGKGVFAYNRETLLVNHLTTENGLSNDVVLDIEGRNDELWLATDGGGINIYNTKTGTVRTIEHSSGELYSLPVNSFYCLYNDPENNIWAGSIRGGLIGMKEVLMKTYKDAPMNSVYGLSEKTVVGMYEDNNGIIWLGTDGGGINRFDPQTKLFKHYPATDQAKVVSIIDFNENELLLSYFSRGLYLFNKQTGTVREYAVTDRRGKHNQMFRSGKSVHLSRLNKDRFYLFADSAYIFNQSEKTLHTITTEEKGLILSSLHFIQGNNYVSYLRGSYDLFEVNPQQYTMRPLYRTGESIGLISAACRDKRGNLWIGSTTGLYLYNFINNTLEPKETNRFIGTVSLGFDNADRLWVGTHNALYAYTPEDERIVFFGESDGISPNEYISKSPLITRSGDMYMAGVMGLSHIQNDLLFVDDPDPVINLLDVMLNGASVSSLVTSDGNHLSVPWNYTSLSTKVIVKENDLLRKKLFRYYIKGNQEEMIESTNHTINFHSLSVGHYEVWVSCNKKNGDWSIPVELLSITVTPPWWKSTWFILLSILFILICTGLVVWTLIKQNESKMILAMKEHEQKTYEEKIRFLINLSHELRTPLTLIYAPLKRLLKSGEITNEDQQQQLTGIFKQTRRIKNLIDMVLDVRKMEVGGEKMNIGNHTLNAWLQMIVDDFTSELSARNMQIVYDLDNSIGEVPFDAAKCEVILSNFLMNAIKFSEPGTVITISTRLEQQLVRVSVSDEGIGLGNVDPKRLFTRFYQGEHDRKGSGIGLSYSRMLVEMHKGKIGAMNNPEKGATFYFELPVINTNSKINSQPYLNELLLSSEQQHAATDDFSMKKYAVLVVEDEAELRDYLKHTFKEYFKQVYVAEDGVEAMEIIQRNQPDIIVSDVMMPRMDGFELCRKVKSDINISHIPVVLLTARTDPESTVLGYKLGADIYLAKPFDLDFLLAILSNQLRNREMIKLRYRDNTQIVSPKEDTISNADEQFIQKLNEMILENIENPDLDVNFVADRMAMSRATLYNKLKLLTDVSIGDYINKFRMAKALQLLANKDLTILEVSERAGFSNQRYFSTVFKQTYGKTPSQYRQEHFI